MKIVALSWHPGNTNILTAGGYTRFFEIVKRCHHQLLIIDKHPSLYSSLKNKKIQVINYSGASHSSFLKKISPLFAKIIDRIISVFQISFILLQKTKTEDIIYIPYSELLELTIPAVFIKIIKGNKIAFCNLNVNTYFFDKPVNVFLHGFSDLTITISRALQKDLEKSGIKAGIVNGVGFDKSTLTSNPKIKKKYDAIYIGRHIQQKGIFDLLEIWNILINKHHIKLNLITIGDIPEYIKLEINKKIKKYGLRNYVELKGTVSDDTKQKLLKESKIMVFPSRQEGWGIAPMEALSVQIPVVAYDLTIYQESIGETESFRTAPLGDKEKFAQIVIDTLDKSELYAKIAERWSPSLSWNEVAKREWRFLESVNDKKEKTN